LVVVWSFFLTGVGAEEAVLGAADELVNAAEEGAKEAAEDKLGEEEASVAAEFAMLVPAGGAAELGATDEAPAAWFACAMRRTRSRFCFCRWCVMHSRMAASPTPAKAASTSTAKMISTNRPASSSSSFGREVVVLTMDSFV